MSANKRGYARLKAMVERGDLKIHFIDGLQRTLSTVLQISLAQLTDGQLHEPFHNASQDRLKRGGVFGYDFDGGCDSICDRAEALMAEHARRPVTLVVKELAKYLPPEDYKRFLPLTESVVFIDREPHLQTYSLLRLRAEQEHGGKLTPAGVLGANDSVVEKALAYDSSSREAMQEHFSLLEEYRKARPDYRVVFASGLSFLADPRAALERIAERVGFLDGLDAEGRADAVRRLERDWTRSTGNNFHGLYTEAAIGDDGITTSKWLGQAVRSTTFQTLGKKEDEPPPLGAFPARAQDHLLQYGLPNYLDALTHPDNMSRLTPEQLDTLRFGAEQRRLEDINPIEAYALALAAGGKGLAENIMKRIRNDHPEHAAAFGVIDRHLAPKVNTVTAVGRHYSGIDHRPYDFATMHPESVDEQFKKSRFAHSLTNLHPRSYSQEEKDRLFTKEFAEHALSAGDISAPRDRTVLWSGGYIPGHPLAYGLGRITAERWLAEKNREVEASGRPYEEIRGQLYHTVAMTEAGLPVLNPMWDDMSVSMDIKCEVTPTYIIGFAQTAKGAITLNVDDTDLDSFFRRNEIDVVMKNPDITTVTVVRIDPATDRLVETHYPDRKSWYEDQKDQWVDSILARYRLATAARDGGAIGEKLFSRMGGALAEELVDSFRNLTEGNPLLQPQGAEEREASNRRERARIECFASVIAAQPALLKHEKIPEAMREGLREFFARKEMPVTNGVACREMSETARISSARVGGG